MYNKNCVSTMRLHVVLSVALVDHAFVLRSFSQCYPLLVDYACLLCCKDLVLHLDAEVRASFDVIAKSLVNTIFHIYT